MQSLLRSATTHSATSLLAALGLLPAVACGGSVDQAAGGGGSTSTSPTTTSTSTDTTTSTGPGYPDHPPTCEELTSGVTVTSSTAIAAQGVGAGGGPVGLVPCQDPEPVLIGCLDSGVDVCANGFMRRRAQVECPVWHRPDASCTPNGQILEDQCSRDSDCGPNSICESYFAGAPAGDACGCIEGCRTDDDCSTGRICLCGEGTGQCVTANCQTDDDCGTYAHCASIRYGGCNPSVGFFCQTDGDLCTTDGDCPQDGIGQMGCEVDGNDVRTCVDNGCMAVGRPLVIAGEVHTAPAVARADWHGAAVDGCEARDVLAIDGDTCGDPALRAAVAAGWTEVAQMEHASIASFARFSLELMALGAPPALLAGSAQAMQDEIAHAEAAFAIATRFGGAPLGPGPLAGCTQAGAAPDIVGLAVATFLEGCLGEGVAAVEARVLAATTKDPAIASVLERVAREEAEHAELAWRTIAWALEVDVARVAPALRSALATAEAAAPAQAAGERDLSAYGLMTCRDRATVRAEVLRDVVSPVLARLVARGAGSGRSAGNHDRVRPAH